MIAIPPDATIFVAVGTIDFRNGITGLGRICREKIKKDPMSGAIFVFRNKKKTTLKILVYDGEAFWLLTRRLSRGKIKWWPTTDQFSCPLDVKKLQVLIMNGNPENVEFGNDWKKLIS
jgi:transposase